MLTTELIPSEIPDSKRVVIVLHGLGDSADGYRWFPSAIRLPWLNVLLVNAPTPYFGGYSWYDFQNDPRPGVDLSRKMLFALLENQAAAGFAAAETVLFGFSQGCLMGLEVGVRYPEVLGGVVGVSGYCLDPDELLAQCSPVARRQRFLLTHGRRDPLLPIDEVRRQVDRLKEGGLNIEWREFDKEHTIAAPEEINLIRSYLCSCFGESTGAHLGDS